MKTSLKYLLATVLLTMGQQGISQNQWTPQQQAIIQAIRQLSAATAPNGGGAVAYGKLLAKNYKRWTLGKTILSNKESWLKGINEWFSEGWRVSDRQSQNLEIHLEGQWAFVRRIVKETYLSPQGKKSYSKAALAEVWKKQQKQWLLYRVDIHPLDVK